MKIGCRKRHVGLPASNLEPRISNLVERGVRVKKDLILVYFFLCAALLLGPLSTLVLAADIITETEPAEDEDAGVAALVLTSSSVENGARNVPVNPLIQLDFTKNVVNFAIVRENNRCYHLVESGGASIPIRIIVPDDQMQQSVKRNVFIRPEENLRPDTIYTLAVDNTLVAKNGDSIDDAYNIVFKTGTQVSDKENSLLTGLGSNVLSFVSDLPMNENSLPGSSPTSSALHRPAGNSRLSLQNIDAESLSRIVLLTAAAALVLVTAQRIRKARKQY